MHARQVLGAIALLASVPSTSATYFFIQGGFSISVQNSTGYTQEVSSGGHIEIDDGWAFVYAINSQWDSDILNCDGFAFIWRPNTREVQWNIDIPNKKGYLIDVDSNAVIPQNENQTCVVSVQGGFW